MSFQIVGTAPLIVGCSDSMTLTSGSACRNRSGITRSPPAMKAAYGMPHALAWNCGTITSATSWNDSANVFIVVAARECSHIERCEQETPLGLPVVPLVEHIAAADVSSTSGHSYAVDAAASASS